MVRQRWLHVWKQNAFRRSVAQTTQLPFLASDQLIISEIERLRSRADVLEEIEELERLTEEHQQ